MTAYRAILQFVEDGPAVTGYWGNPAVAPKRRFSPLCGRR